MLVFVVLIPFSMGLCWLLRNRDARQAAEVLRALEDVQLETQRQQNANATNK
jgi:hypothetical protein